MARLSEHLGHGEMFAMLAWSLDGPTVSKRKTWNQGFLKSVVVDLFQSYFRVFISRMIFVGVSVFVISAAAFGDHFLSAPRWLLFATMSIIAGTTMPSRS